MDDPVTVEQFCRRYVEPMGEESDHIHIVAITDALQVCMQGCDLVGICLACNCNGTCCRIQSSHSDSLHIALMINHLHAWRVTLLLMASCWRRFLSEWCI